MPTIVGSKSGTRPYLELDWTATSQDVANNRTRVNLKLYLKVDYSIQYSARYTGTLYGASFTSSSGYISRPGRYLLTERNVWVNHNSDGRKTESISADYNLNITWGGTYHGKITLSGSMALTAIPRASDFTAFGLSSTTLSGGTANTVTYTLGRKSSNFSHLMTLKLGSYQVAQWTDSGTGDRTRALTSTQVNNIINRTPNGTSGTLTLIMQTRSGSSNIGSSVSRTRTFSLNSNIKPTASGLSVSISGSGRDKSIGKYVQGISRVYVSFSPKGTYSSTIKSNKVTISRSGQTMTVSGSSGTSAVLSQYGDYNITAETTDSRGRKGTASAKITVEAYKAPSISSFSANRRTSSSSTVDIVRRGSWSNLGGDNNLTYTLTRTGTSSPLQSGTWTGGSFDSSYASTGNLDTASYEFTLTVKDTFGREATSMSRIGTAFQELTIARGQGVGIGKVHEQGVLDVDGDAYFKGKIIADRTVSYYSPYHDEISSFDDITTEWSLVSGALHNNPMNIQDDLGHSGSFVYVNTVHYTTGYKKQMAYGYTSNQTWSRFQYNGVWSSWVEDGGLSGSNNNGKWFRFADGLQICIMYVIPDRRTTAQFTVPYPKQFTGDVALFGSPRSGTAVDYNRSNASLVLGVHNTSGTSSFHYQFMTTTSTGYNWFIRVVAIGRWK